MALAIFAGSVVFTYTTVLNIGERPEGMKISMFFIGTIVVVSLISRAIRSTELRIKDVHLDEVAKSLLAEDEDQLIRLVARRPGNCNPPHLDMVDRAVRHIHNLDASRTALFF